MPAAAITGAWTGLGLGVAGLRAQRYRDLGLDWLAVDTVTTLVDRALITGLGIGAGLTLLGFLLRPWILRSLGRWTGVQMRDRMRVEAAVLCLLLGVGVLIAGGKILNDRYIPFDFTRRYWVLNGGWLLGTAAGAWILYGVLVGAKTRRWLERRGLATLLVTTGATLLLVLGLNVYRNGARPAPPAGARDVILLTVDTQRADHLGCYGYGRPTSPRLDALAESGQLYLHAFSHAPVTSSSFSCIMTGYRPRETGTYGNDPAPLSLPTMAEYLRNSGYRTAAIVSNFVLRRGKNHDQGFEHYDDRMDDREAVRRTPERIGAHTTRDALSWLARAPRDRPLFLWVHYQDPHGPYLPPREYQSLFLDESARGSPLRVTDSVRGDGGIPSYQVLDHHREYGYYVAQYDAEIRYFDDCLHDLVQGLKAQDRWDEALIVFTSDHGEGMGEHEYYFAHGDHLYPGQLHVPLILWGPGLPPARREALAQSADIAATVLEFAGVSPVTRLPGRNLLDSEMAALEADAVGATDAAAPVGVSDAVSSGGASTAASPEGVRTAASPEDASNAATPAGVNTAASPEGANTAASPAGASSHAELRGVLAETFVSDNYKAALMGRWLQAVYDAHNGDYRAYDIERGIFVSADSLAAAADWKALVQELEKQRNPSARRVPAGGVGQEERELMKSLGYIN